MQIQTQFHQTDEQTPPPHRARLPNRLNLIKTALTLGVIFAGCHLLWVLLVVIGGAQSIMNFLFWAHMVAPVYVVRPFNPFAAITLLLMTFSTGYVLGITGAALWNHLRFK